MRGSMILELNDWADLDAARTELQAQFLREGVRTANEGLDD